MQSLAGKYAALDLSEHDVRNVNFYTLFLISEEEKQYCVYKFNFTERGSKKTGFYSTNLIRALGAYICAMVHQ